jgi:putative hydrolase of the HAD superfamily
MKPDPAIYRAAISSAQCAPEECFFTDDIPEYIQAATLAGIDAVQFLGYASLVEELEQRGVQVRR